MDAHGSRTVSETCRQESGEQEEGAFIFEDFAQGDWHRAIVKLRVGLHPGLDDVDRRRISMRYSGGDASGHEISPVCASAGAGAQAGSQSDATRCHQRNEHFDALFTRR